MIRFMAMVAAALLATACEKGGGNDQAASGGSPGPVGGGGGPLRLGFGDCAGDGVRFVSGPRPEPFDLDALEAEGKMGKKEEARVEGLYQFEKRTVDPQLARKQALEEAKRGVTLGAPLSSGSLDKAIIRRYIRRQLPRIKYCYEKQLLIDSKLQGTVKTSFRITADGTVTDSKAEGVDAKVSSCVAQAIATIQFPKPQDGQAVQVNYPFTFRPTDEGESEAPAAPAEPPAPAEPAPPPTPEPTLARKPPTRAGAYQPGGESPLRPHAAGIQACLRQHAGQSHGALAVDLTVDGAGAVTTGRTHGVNDQTSACIAEALRSATWSGATARAYRCPAAFGTLAADVAPGVDITPTAIRLGKEQVGDPAEITRTDSDPAEWKVMGLYDRLRADDDRRAAAADVVAITGPLILRPEDQVPMQVVNRVLMTVKAADADAVLAARRGGTWKLLREVALPVIPVPRGTGGRWSDGKAVARAALVATEDDAPVTASLMITPDAIWFGLSRINDIQRIAATAAGHDWAALAEALATAKKSAHLVDRADIAIAAEDAVLYGDAVKVIDAATRAGFLDWQLSAPQSLPVRFQ